VSTSVSTPVASRTLRLARAFLRDVRSPDWGLAGQGIRFAVSGVLVALVYISVTTLLHEAFGVRFQIALASGFLAGLALHFTLQRLFVWRHHQSFALALHQQAARYLLICLTQYGITALSTAQLPSLLGLPVEIVYLMTVISITGANFMLFRGRVFHGVAAVGDGQAT
jgi:putative flippase GtrA